MTGPGGMGPLRPMGVDHTEDMFDAIMLLGPLSYWTLRGNDSNTLHDWGTLAHDMSLQGVPTPSVNTTPGSDGYNYPSSAAGGYAQAVDDAQYTPSNGGTGLTIIGLVMGHGNATGSNFLAKANTSSGGEWTCAINDTAGTLKASQTSNGTAHSQTTDDVLTPSDWNLFIMRFDGANGTPTVRINGLNSYGTNAGTGTIVANGVEAFKLFGAGTSGANHASVSMAHVAVFDGQFSDAQCKTIEDAATSAGWNWKSIPVFGSTSGTITSLADGRTMTKYLVSDTLTVTTPGLAQIWVVAPGGGGGSHNTTGAGGGGAGGLIRRTRRITSSKTITLVAGGAATPISGTFPVAAGNNTFDTLTANGGGGGGSTSSWRAGLAGGCGGGGGTSTGGGGAGSTQGQAGGTGATAGAGGGGTVGIGANASGTVAGLGGTGIVGPDGLTYCVGGGGHGATPATQTSQTANTGNGGNARTVAQGNGQVGCTGCCMVVHHSAIS